MGICEIVVLRSVVKNKYTLCNNLEQFANCECSIVSPVVSKRHFLLTDLFEVRNKQKIIIIMQSS